MFPGAQGSHHYNDVCVSPSLGHEMPEGPGLPLADALWMLGGY